ncbi:endonuclease [Tropicibacter sp. S64]|uniref:endonuclease n=1 Tax=Tropicibacter sp. S64 TaxID=3415122 RepID=UPI003C7B08F9
MSGPSGNCTMKCWGVAGGLGALCFLLNLGTVGFAASLLLGLLVFGLFGLLFTWMFCKSGTASVANASTGAALTGAAVGPAATPKAASAVAKPTEAAKPAETAKPAAAPAEEPESGEAVETAGTGDTDSLVKPSKALAGEADLDSRKGEWKYDGGADGGKTPVADAGEPAGEEPAQAADTGASDGGPVIKPSKPLAGTAELASRKGTWKYGGDASAAGAPGDSVDRDGDGVIEGANEGSKPAMLEGARGGKPDNLKEIKGIGPKLEDLCHDLGIYHFDQIAAWSADELAWIDANLIGFKGRATRDDWVGQAKILAAGGETEFSQRVEDGKVY